MSASIQAADGIHVHEFHQILIWPLQLMPLKKGSDLTSHWDFIARDPLLYQERHYREFVAFLPHVQRFLYGERASRTGRTTYGESPMRIYRRNDISAVRVYFDAASDPLTLEVVHADLYFFFDVDVVIPVVEIKAHGLSLTRAQELIYRFGRAYPAGWNTDGSALHCFSRVEWLDAKGDVLSASDYDNRGKFFSSVCEGQTTTISSHWEFLLAPMIINQRAESCPVRYRQLEFHRMPTMSYLSVDDPTSLTRGDYMRLAYASAPGEPEATPYSEVFLNDFERRFCYDRFFDPSRKTGIPNTRIVCSGQSFVAIGEASQPFFADKERGFLSQFRHQYFLVGLIAHFHRAALLMLSDRLVATVSRLDLDDNESVSRFRYDIRQTLETFLRFTHRYYFSEISDQLPVRDVFRIWTGHLGTERLYNELREEIGDMSAYLETDLLRRQAKTILQLTVATLLSLILTIATGFLGMNIFSYADMSALEKTTIFMLVLVPTTALVLYMVMKSRRLAEFLDELADEKVKWRQKIATLARVWRR